MASQPPARPLDPRLKQHRCHPRLADCVHSLSACPGELPSRIGLLLRCYRSEPGAEPTEPFLLDPAKHALRMRDFGNAGAGATLPVPGAAGGEGGRQQTR